jgi:hypothetical protein
VASGPVTGDREVPIADGLAGGEGDNIERFVGRYTALERYASTLVDRDPTGSLRSELRLPAR